MTSLTDTLLWLGRTDDETPPSVPVDLVELVRKIVADREEPARMNGVQVKIESLPVSMSENGDSLNLPVMIAHMVLSNLVSNAIKHTRDGQVSIAIAHNRVMITNSGAWKTDNTGFGLGLQLVTNLTNRMNWHYESLELASGFTVVLDFGKRASVPAAGSLGLNPEGQIARS